MPEAWPPKGVNRFGEETRYAGTEYGETYDETFTQVPGVGPNLRRLVFTLFAVFAVIALASALAFGKG